MVFFLFYNQKITLKTVIHIHMNCSKRRIFQSNTQKQFKGLIKFFYFPHLMVNARMGDVKKSRLELKVILSRNKGVKNTLLV